MSPRDEKKQQARDESCKPVLDAMKSFCGLPADDVTGAAFVAGLLSAPDNELSEADAQIIIDWANDIHSRAVMLQMVLAGTEISVVDGEVNFRMPDDADGYMRNLVRYGIAKKVQPPA